MAAIKIDAPLFWARLGRLHSQWQAKKASKAWNNASSICIPVGKASEEALYAKSAAVQSFLFTYELAETIIVMTASTVFVLSSSKITKILAPLKAAKTGTPSLTLMTRNRSNADAGNIRTLIEAAVAAGPKSGGFWREAQTGSFATSFRTALDTSGLELVEVSSGVASVLAIKDKRELDCTKKAGAVASRVMTKAFTASMEDIVDAEKKVKHSAIAEDLDSSFENLKKLGLDGKLTKEFIEPCYFPIIQSGGKYNIRPSAQSNDDELAYDVIICSVGARYKSYCTNISRTFLVDPTKAAENAYKAAFKAQAAAREALTAGAAMSAVYAAVKASLGPYAQYMPNNVGFGLGISFRDTTLLLNQKNRRLVRPGQVFNLSVGLQNVPVPPGQQKPGAITEFSILIADSVIIPPSGSAVEVTRVHKKFGDISYFLDGEDEESEEEDEENETKSAAPAAARRSRRAAAAAADFGQGSSRGAGETKSGLEEKRLQHQAELRRKKREEAVARLQAEKLGQLSKKSSAKLRKFRAYKRPEDFPSEARQTQIMVDVARESILVPIGGVLVPFHIATVKSVNKSEDFEATFLRINFYSPGQNLGKDVPPSMTSAIAANPLAVFVKELNFRCKDSRNLNTQLRLIKELQKRVRSRDKEAQEKADLVKQPDLILAPRSRKIPRLQDLSMRPHLSGRKTQGTLEVHTNGVRFKSIKQERLDIVFSNIRHALFQPCENELVVLIHFNLRNPIMIGKKKHVDVQFYTEVIEASQVLDERRGRAYDPDELDEEQRERALRKRLNQAFKNFCTKMEEVVESSGESLTFDIPYRELSFHGTPNKEMVRLQPSVHCLVNLTESPAFVVPLDTIEHVHFERVTFTGKAFDMVIIYKDFTKEPVRINAIPMKELDKVKEWLDDVNMVFTGGPQNLNWKSIMKTVVGEGEWFWKSVDENGDPKPAGWEFLKMTDSDSEDDADDADSSFSEGGGSSASEESEYDSEELVDEAELEPSEDESEEDEGLSWEELDRQAAAADRDRGEFSSKRPRDEQQRGRSRPQKRRR